MTLKILSLVAMSAGEEICVTLETVSDGGEHTLREKTVISSRDYLSMGLVKGEISTDTYDRIIQASSYWRAKKKAAAILASSSCSDKALKLKLMARGFDKQTAEQAVTHMCDRGLLDTTSDACREAQKMARKLWGRKRISSALYAKGYSSEDTTAALNFLDDGGIDYTKNCLSLLKSKCSVLPSDPKQRQKLTASLVRYGYDLSEIRSAYFSFETEK